MAITIICANPACRRPHGVADGDLGHAVRCPHCGETSPAPAPSAGPTSDPHPVAAGVAPPPAADEAAPRTVGRFVVRERLGAGAFGTVYRAYDPQLEREVAVKVPRARTLRDPRRVARFLGEARAAARLRHPHIVPVYDAGEEGGRPYIACALVTGTTLEQAMAGGGINARHAAAIVRDLADALAYAHRLGIVHRDVKPGNVILDSAGEPHLADFGLAHREDAHETATRAGAVLGTPAYMAPEQAAGAQGDPQPASDQYSLGVVLYELLCGERPFAGQHPLALAYHLTTRRPAGPRSVRPDVPRDLEAVCLKALATRPEDRYATCQDFAGDLRRWLEGEPVRARPLGVPERLLYWSKRDPRLALAAGAVAACLVAVALVSTFSARREATARRAADEARGQAEQAETREAEQRELAEKAARDALRLAREARAAEGTAKDALQAVEEARGQLEKALTEKGTALAELQRATADLRRTLYYRLTTGAERELRDNNAERARQLLGLCRPESSKELAALRGWEWYHLEDVCGRRLESPGDPGGASNRLAFNPFDSLQLAFVLRGKAVLLWDLRNPERRPKELGDPDGPAADVCCVCFSRDGKRLATGGRAGTVTVWDVTTGKVVSRPGRVHTAPVRCVAFNADRTLLASGGDDRRVVVWDLKDGKPPRTLEGHPAPVRTVEFSPDKGAFDPNNPKRLPPLLCSACQGNEVRLWYANPGPAQGDQWKDPLPGYTAVTASPDGRRLALVKENGAVEVSDLTDVTGKKKPGFFYATPTGEEVPRAVFSSDGKQLACLAGHSARVLDAESGRVLFDQPALGFAFNGATRMAILGEDDTLRSWYVPTGRSSLYRPGGAAPAAEVLTHAGYRRHVLGTAVSPDGKHLATASGFVKDNEEKGEVKVWDLLTGAEVPERTYPDDAKVFCVAYSRDGKRLASCAGDGLVKLRDLAGGEVLTLRGHTDKVWFVAYSPDGNRVASAGAGKDRTVRLWDARTGKLLHRLGPFAGGVSWVAFHPDGERLAVASERDPRVTVWRVPVDGKEATPAGVFKGHPQPVTSVAYSPDKKLLAAGGEDSTVRIWDAETGQELRVLKGHRKAVVAVAFSPDGKRLASASTDATVRLWDSETGEEALSLKSDTRFTSGLTFSPKGDYLVAGSVDGVKVWHAPPPR
jgi:WD40 repeat protein/tRNA A-37 threonylcarbamoyl transferase component Bud32